MNERKRVAYLVINLDSVDLREGPVAPLNLIVLVVRDALIFVHRRTGDADEGVGGALAKIEIHLLTA